MIPTPFAFRASARLHYFIRFLMYAAGSLKSVVWFEHENCGLESWFSIILQDLSWLKQSCYQLRHLPDPVLDADPWIDMIRSLPGEFFKQLDLALQDSAVKCGESDSEGTDSPHETYTCFECNAQFDDPQSLGSHMFSIHDLRNPIRSKIGSTTCACCLTNFHIRYNLFKHVAYRSPKCKRFYVSQSDLGDEVLFQLELDETSRCSHARLDGVPVTFFPSLPVRLHGPLIRVAEDDLTP